MQAAALSSSSGEAVGWFEAPSSVPPRFLRQAAAVVGARGRPAEVRRVLDRMGEASGAAVLEGLAEGVRARRSSAKSLQGTRLLPLAVGASPPLRRAALSLLEVAGLPAGAASQQALRNAEGVARDPAAAPSDREDAVRLLGLGPAPPLELLDALLDPREPEAVSRAAARAMGRVKGEEVGRLLLARWRTMTPAVRSDAADALQADRARFPLLMAALEKKEVQGWTLNFDQKRRLLMNRDPALRERARALLDAAPAERAKVLAAYQPALKMEGDVARGEKVFRAVCARCHRRDGQGGEVGGDLGTVRNRPASVLLTDILDPSRAIAQSYESWVVETRGGDTHEGVLAAQTATSITLRRDGHPDVSLPRAEITRMTAANLSAMPGDLESQITVAQMADLLRYLTAR